MWQRFSEDARRAIFYSQEEAQRFGEGYVATEHLLLGLLRDSETAAVRALAKLGVSQEIVRIEVEKHLPSGNARPSQDMTLTPRAKRVIDLAYDEARNLNNDYIGTEHLLLGLVSESDGLGGRSLYKVGVRLEEARRAVMEIQDQEPREQKPMPPRISTTKSTAGAYGPYGAFPAYLSATMLLIRHRRLTADVLALILLSDGAPDLAKGLDELGLTPQQLIEEIEMALMQVPLGKRLEDARIADFWSGSMEPTTLFMTIALLPDSYTHHALLQFGVTDERIRTAFASDGS